MKKTLLLVAFTVAFAFTSKAAIFYDVNADGDTIFYELERFNEDTVLYVCASQGGEYKDTLVIPSSVEVDGKEVEVKMIARGAFDGYVNLKKLVMPNTITVIQSYAFNNCSQLVDITFPTALEQIGGSALNNCAWFDNKPDGPVVVDNRIFVAYKGEMAANTTYTVPQRIVQICGEAFAGQVNLVDIVFPSSLKRISSYAFSGTGLTSLVIPNSVVSVGEYIVDGCLNLHTLVYSDKIKKLQYGLGHCPMLDNITLGSGIESVYYEYFDDTKWATEHPDGLMYLGPILYGYKGDTPANAPIVVQDGTRQICGEVFMNDTNIVKVTLPSSIKKISSHAFDSCVNLDTLVLPCAIVPHLGDLVFNDVPTSLTIMVPADMVAYYQGEDEWSDFNIQTIITTSVPSVEAKADEFVQVDGKLIFAEDTQVAIYTATGVCVYVGRTSEVNIDNAGIYILKTEKGATKFVVR